MAVVGRLEEYPEWLDPKDFRRRFDSKDPDNSVRLDLMSIRHVGIAHVIDAVSGENVLTMRSSATDLSKVTFSSDSGRIALGANDGTVEVWDIAKRCRIASIQVHPGNVRTISFVADNRVLSVHSATAARIEQL